MTSEQPQEIAIKADIDGDGVQEEVKIPLPKDKRFWAIVAIVIGIIAGTKSIGLW